MARRHLPAPAGSACAGRKTCACPPPSPAGTATAATPNSLPSPRTSPTGFPEAFPDEEAAPLLCAGIIGYRALSRAELPIGGRLGIYGFGASAHLAAQIALYQGAQVYVMTRSPEARRLALDLGATFAGGAEEEPPDPLDAAILFAPAGTWCRRRCGPSTVAGPSPSPASTSATFRALHYAAELFQERQLRSVTANTRADGEEFFRIAAEIPLRPTTVAYPFDAADQALRDLAADRVTGAAVIRVAP